MQTIIPVNVNKLLPITKADRKCFTKWMQKKKNRAQLQRILQTGTSEQKEYLINEFTANPYANLKV